MKNNLRRLNAIMKLFPENVFYSNTITEYECRLQGRFSQSTIARMKEIKFVVAIDQDGYVRGERGYYTITLTD
jgi:hypothetical protein